MEPTNRSHPILQMRALATKRQPPARYFEHRLFSMSREQLSLFWQTYLEGGCLFCKKSPMTSKETCKNENKRTDVKRDLLTLSMSREWLSLFWQSYLEGGCLYRHLSQKRPMNIKRALRTSKETHQRDVNQKRHTKGTYRLFRLSERDCLPRHFGQKRPIKIKRDILARPWSKATYKRHLHTL